MPPNPDEFATIIQDAWDSPPPVPAPAAGPPAHRVVWFAKGTAWWLLSANLAVVLVLLVRFLAHVHG